MADKAALPIALETKTPYPQSWMDALVGWIDGFPANGLGFYLLAGLGLGVFINAIFWIDGSVPFGTVDPFNTSFSLFVLYWIALYQYLTHVGSRSLETFRPLLNVPDSEVERIEYELAKLPRWLGWISIPLGYGVFAADILGNPQEYGDLVPNTVLIPIGDIALTGFMATCFICLLIRSVRQLRMVAKLHSRATSINLLELEPAHAFSELTSRTGIGVIFVLIFSLFLAPTAEKTAFDVITDAFVGVIAVAIFVVPLRGMRGLLEKEKERVLNEISQLLQDTRQLFHSKVKRQDYDSLDGMETAISTLIRERELFQKISTWPWKTGTLRGFGSTLLLPIFIWLITRVLERFI
jgi:hypothetical protein